MIVLVLGGGLGNQMFEYAFARSLQKKFGDKKIKLSLYHVGEYMSNKEVLHHLQLNGTVTKCSGIETKAFRLHEKLVRNFILRKNSLKITDKDAFSKLSEHGIYYLPGATDFFKCSPKSAALKHIYGVYENPKYWEEIRDALKKELKVITPPSEENRKMAEEISAENAVCVHIRRGDYVNNPMWSFLNICSESYYQKAIEEIKTRVKNPVFYIFSNNHTEITWIQKNYHFGDVDLRYVDLNNPDYEELRLMYQCKHFIIANSTFSWWAQFLSDNPNKLVCAPSKWSTRFDGSCFYEKDWILIDV